MNSTSGQPILCCLRESSFSSAPRNLSRSLQVMHVETFGCTEPPFSHAIGIASSVLFSEGGRCEVQIMASTMAGTTECLSNHLLGFLVGFGMLGRCVRRTDCCLPSQSGLQKRVICEGASKLCFSLGEDACTLVSGLSRAGRDSAQPLPTQETSAILPLPCKCGFTVHFFHKLSIVICGPLFIPMWCSRCYVLCSHPLPNNRRKCVFM